MTETFDNLFDPFFNKHIVDGLKYLSGWRLASISENDVSLIGPYSDTGFLLQTYTKNSPDGYNPKLNAYAELVLAKVLDQSKYIFHDMSPYRYFWNYYNTASTGILHRDILPDIEGNFMSILYNLNDNDGGTEVDNIVYTSQQSRAIMFNSRTLHRGIGPTQSKQRFSLNVVFQYSSKVLKNVGNQTNRILL